MAADKVRRCGRCSRLLDVLNTCMRCSGGMAVSNEVVGTYGVWVSRGRTPMVNIWRPDSVVQVRPVPMAEPCMEQVTTPSQLAPPPPAQPPAEEMDRILLEYARAAGFSTAGYKNDRAYWRRQVGWMIKQHADRLRYG